MSAAAPVAAWAARTAGLASTSGRHAAPFTTLQPTTVRRPSGSGSGSAAVGLLPRAQALSYDGRPGPATSSRPYVNRAPGGVPLQQGGAAGVGQRAYAPSSQQPAEQQPQPQHQQQQLEQLAVAAAQQQAADAAPEPQNLDTAEMRRRQKISAANKGRVPWNKGRKHPPEVIARIRAATQLAMQRPDVKERLAKANEKREPHTNEAKAKIRVKLLERAHVAREEINIQAKQILLERLAGSDDPDLQELAEFPRAHEVVAGLAWQFFKKDWTEVSTTGWEQHPDFRERCIAKLSKLANKERTVAVPKKKKVDRVKAALGHMKKLEEARSKLNAAEQAVEKLRRAKIAFAGDAARLAAASAAEEKATQLLGKLRQQVSRLETALQPLEEYLEAESAATPVVLGSSSLNTRDLERCLESAQQQQLERGAAAAALNGHAADASEAVAAEEEDSASGSQGGVFGGSSNGVLFGQTSMGNGAEAAASGLSNGHAASGPAQGAGAFPGRSALPWQR